MNDPFAHVLEILRCPESGSALVREGDALVSAEGVRYPIRDGIPIMLADEARPLDD